jgi:hypothetical protein
MWNVGTVAANNDIEDVRPDAHDAIIAADEG